VSLQSHDFRFVKASLALRAALRVGIDQIDSAGVKLSRDASQSARAADYTLGNLTTGSDTDSTVLDLRERTIISFPRGAQMSQRPTSARLRGI